MPLITSKITPPMKSSMASNRTKPHTMRVGKRGTSPVAKYSHNTGYNAVKAATDSNKEREEKKA